MRSPCPAEWHRETRRYLYLTSGPRAYERAPCDGFVPLRLDFALQRALSNWWRLAGFDGAMKTAVREAILRANTSAYHGLDPA